MRAVVYDRYGPPDVLRVEEVPVPSPGQNQVLVEVVARSVNLSDREGLRGSPMYARIGGLRAPARRVLGSDIAGRVAAVGSGATRFRLGDEVYGDNLGLMGGFAEYALAPEAALAPKPEQLTFDEASTLPQSAIQLAALSAARVTGIDTAAQAGGPSWPGRGRRTSSPLRSVASHRIDRTFTLGEVPQALAYVGEGRALGKVVITA